VQPTDTPVKKIDGNDMNNKMIHVEVHPPEIHLGDTFVRVAGAEPSPVNITVEPSPVQVGDTIQHLPQPKTVESIVRAERQADGSIVAKIVHQDELKKD